MSFTFTTSGACKLAAGANTSEGDILGSEFEDWSDKVEDEICLVMRYDAITNYGSLTTNAKKILGALEDVMIAQKIIGYNPAEIGLSESAIRLNVLENEKDRLMGYIKDDKFKAFLGVPE